MGREVVCYGTGTAGSGEGRLLLETNELIFRGPARVRIPLAEVREARAAGHRLVVRYEGGSMDFEVGPDAEKWAARIKEPRGRLDKLGIKADSTVSVVGVKDAALKAELAGSGATVSHGRVRRGSTVVLLGAESVQDLARLAAIRDAIASAGGIWVIHRRGPGALKDVEIFAAGKALGLVSNKVMRFSETHSADRLVIPKDQRPVSRPRSSRTA